jgi:hypothetical protein
MYYGVGIIILAVLVYVVWASFFNSPATCLDNKQDGTELGVDCGGQCALLCQDTAKDPTVSWARSFQTGTPSTGSGQATTYTAAAYIQNNNPGAGAKRVAYSFQLFDANNSLIKEADGTTDLPPVSVIPIIMPNISVGNRTVTHVEFAFSNPPVWYKIPAKSLPTLFVSQQNLAADGSRLSATISNQTLADAKGVTVAAVLFDSNGVARAASKSLVQVIAAQSAQNVTFTWPTGTPNIVRAEITVLPSF